LLILPNAWSLSVIWAINQRVTIRRKMRSTISDDASLAHRLEVVGWRNGVTAVEGNGHDGSRRDSMGLDPSRWRGDDETETHSSELSSPEFCSLSYRVLLSRRICKTIDESGEQITKPNQITQVSNSILHHLTPLNRLRSKPESAGFGSRQKRK
jgi:hypothetical protein